MGPGEAAVAQDQTRGIVGSKNKFSFWKILEVVEVLGGLNSHVLAQIFSRVAGDALTHLFICEI